MSVSSQGETALGASLSSQTGGVLEEFQSEKSCSWSPTESLGPESFLGSLSAVVVVCFFKMTLSEQP